MRPDGRIGHPSAQQRPAAPHPVMTGDCARPGRVLVLADAARLEHVYAPALDPAFTMAARPGDATHEAFEQGPALVCCRDVDAVEEALQGPGTFQLAFLSAETCDTETLVRLAAEMRRRQPGVRIVCCDHDGAIADAGFDVILRGGVDSGQIRAIGRTLLDASRACVQRDVALAQLHVTGRLADIGHWLWNRRTGQVQWCMSLARLMNLGPCWPEATLESVMDSVHPEDRARVRDRLQRATPECAFTMRYRVALADGAQRSLHQESSLDLSLDAQEWVVCAVREADGEHSASETIRKLAYFDPLTELPNRSFLNEHLRNVLVHARRHDRLVAILHVNLDGFKRINDTLGHDAGDRILQEVALRLQDCVRDSDCVAREPTGNGLWPDDASEDAVARFGADEFIVVLSEVMSSEDPEAVADRIVNRLREPVSLDGRELIIGASIGVTLYPEDADNEDALLRNAALALQCARRRGRNVYHRFERSLLTPSIDRLNLEAKLRQAMDQGGLSLHYQPKVSAVTGEVVGAEALLRWEHPDLGSVPPAQFIPIAEESGLILPLGEWVVSEVCRQLAAWRDAGFTMLPVSINVSAQQLYDRSLGRKVTQALDMAGLEPRDLEFEITESVLMDDVGDGEQRLRELKALGSLISMDDFGTGYSSLSYLKRLPIDVVKIDRSFVRDILREEDDQAILRAIIAMAHQLRLRIVAEGVETDAQMQLLQTMQCDLIQGYVVSRPLPADIFAARFLSVDQRLAS